ncbi:hypothetical protein BJY04DRAFT_192638 [Aspergillus karnatakaensis]|uniref:uncharacterized protein n=1 Tax=Aspergillus karnatakaensis TaxID=1810916 RepID=UPI003CCCDC35
MNILSTLLPVALLVAVGAAAPARLNRGHDARHAAPQAPIETHVPFPPGSGGSHGHGHANGNNGGHHCPGLGGHQGHGTELCIHFREDGSKDNTDAESKVEARGDAPFNDIPTAPGSGGVDVDEDLDNHPTGTIEPLFPILNTSGSTGTITRTTFATGGLPHFAGHGEPEITFTLPTVPAFSVVDEVSDTAAPQEPTEAPIPARLATGSDNGRVSADFVGNCVQHNDCAFGLVCYQFWCTAPRDLGLGHDWN